MRKLIGSIFSFLLLLSPVWSWACPVCERQQPKLLRGIIHGVGPEDNTDYIIIGMVALSVLATLFFSIKMLVRPGEKSVDHIKRMVIDQEDYDG